MAKRVLAGTVSIGEKDKVTVRVERRFTHPVLKKTVRRSKKYRAEEEGDEFGSYVWRDSKSGKVAKLAILRPQNPPTSKTANEIRRAIRGTYAAPKAK